ncbi:fluoride efflux transporter CrcB [Emcibacter nanhaiensis]|uniref:Fluoride-specific ion channel FluC n=1 Tax=Emcibacter nanhaiensis TaxID=1505037 RepID=A0A501PJG3_9PROT|nr:fluoride efflux transporter CrcB [Emcibacter nanhaiensis]TPD60609.1 fluoride efflux transporter CrcB [Emcibacter nanhaiensis]
MYAVLAVAAGGALGATCRFLVGRLMMNLMGPGFPWATLTVNIVGSFAIGLIVHLLAVRFQLSHIWQIFLVTGVLGGFTTFSAFSLELGNMLQHDNLSLAALYGIGSVVLGLFAVFGGIWMARLIAG